MNKYWCIGNTISMYPISMKSSLSTSGNCLIGKQYECYLGESAAPARFNFFSRFPKWTVSDPQTKKLIPIDIGPYQSHEEELAVGSSTSGASNCKYSSCNRIRLVAIMDMERRKAFPVGCTDFMAVLADRMWPYMSNICIFNHIETYSQTACISSHCHNLACDLTYTGPILPFKTLFRHLVQQLLPKTQMGDVEKPLGEEPSETERASTTAISTAQEVDRVGRVINMMPSIKYASTEKTMSFKQVEGRWVRIIYFQADTTHLEGTHLATIPLPMSLYTDNLAPYMIPFERFAYGTYNISIKVRINTQKFQAGLFVVSVLIDPTDLARDYDHINSFLTRDVMALLDINAQNEVEVNVPFIYHKAFVTHHGMSQASFPLLYATVFVTVVDPINVASGQESQVGGSILVKISDAKFSALTYSVPPDNISIDTLKKNALGPTTQGPIHLATDIVSTAVGIGNLWISGVKLMDEIGRRFGIPTSVLDKPWDCTSMQVVPRPRQAFTWGVGPSDAIPMQLDPTAKTSFPDDIRAMLFSGSLKSLLRKYSILSIVSWSADNDPGTLLFSIPINPANFGYKTSSFKLKNTLLEYITAPFAFYRGTIEFKVILVGTDFHRGSLEFTAEFGRETTMEAQGTSTYVHMLDVGQERQIEFIIPYIYDTVVRRTGSQAYYPMNLNFATKTTQYLTALIPDPRAFFKIRVLNKLRNVATVPDTMKLIVMVRGGDDYVVLNPIMSPHTWSGSYAKYGDQVPPVYPGTTQSGAVFEPGPDNAHCVNSEDNMNVYQILQRPIQILCDAFVKKREFSDTPPLTIEDRYNIFSIPLKPPSQMLWGWDDDGAYPNKSGGRSDAMLNSCHVMVLRMFRFWRGSMRYTIVIKPYNGVMPTVVYVSVVPHTGVEMFGNSHERFRVRETDKPDPTKDGYNVAGFSTPSMVGLPTVMIVPSINPTESIEVPFAIENNFCLMHRTNYHDQSRFSDMGNYNVGHLLVWSTDASFKMDIFWAGGDDFRMGGFLGMPKYTSHTPGLTDADYVPPKVTARVSSATVADSIVRSMSTQTRSVSSLSDKLAVASVPVVPTIVSHSTQRNTTVSDNDVAAATATTSTTEPTTTLEAVGDQGLLDTRGAQMPKPSASYRVNVSGNIRNAGNICDRPNLYEFPQTTTDLLAWTAKIDLYLSANAIAKMKGYCKLNKLPDDTWITSTYVRGIVYRTVNTEEYGVLLPYFSQYMTCAQHPNTSFAVNWIPYQLAATTQMMEGFCNGVASIVSTTSSALKTAIPTLAPPIGAGVVGYFAPSLAPAVGAGASMYAVGKVTNSVEKTLPVVTQTLQSVDDAAKTINESVSMLTDRANMSLNGLDAIVEGIRKALFPTLDSIDVVSKVVDIITDSVIAWRSSDSLIRAVCVIRVLKTLGLGVSAIWNNWTQYETVLTQLFGGTIASSPEVQAEGEVDNQDLICSLLGLTVGLISATLGVSAPRVPSGTMRSWLSTFTTSMFTSGTWSVIRNATLFFKPFFSVIRSMIYWLMGYVDPDVNVLILAGEKSVKIKEFVDDVQSVTNPANLTYIKTPKGKFVAWRTYVMAEQILRALTGAERNVPMTALYRTAVTYTKWMQDKFLTLTTCPVRWEPFVLWINGPTRAGKSYLATHLATMLFKAFEMQIPGVELIFKRTPAKNFWDGFTDQPVIVYDDFGNIKNPDVLATQIDELYQLKTSQPMSVNMARLEEKEFRANPVLVIVLSNQAFELGTNVIRDQNAFHGRRDMLWEVQKVSDYNDSSATVSFDHLQFKQYTNVTEAGSEANSPVVDFATFFGDVAMTMSNFMDKERLHVMRRMAALMEISRAGAHGVPNVEDPLTYFNNANRIVAEDPTLWQNVSTPAEALTAQIERLAVLVDAPQPVQIFKPIGDCNIAVKKIDGKSLTDMKLDMLAKAAERGDVHAPIYWRIRYLRKAGVVDNDLSNVEVPEATTPRPLVPRVEELCPWERVNNPPVANQFITLPHWLQMPVFGVPGCVLTWAADALEPSFVRVYNWIKSKSATTIVTGKCCVCFEEPVALIAQCKNARPESPHAVCSNCFLRLNSNACPQCRVGVLDIAAGVCLTWYDELLDLLRSIPALTVKLAAMLIIFAMRCLATYYDIDFLACQSLLFWAGYCYNSPLMMLYMALNTAAIGLVAFCLEPNRHPITQLMHFLAAVRTQFNTWTTGPPPQAQYLVTDFTHSTPLPNFEPPEVQELQLCVHRIQNDHLDFSDPRHLQLSDARNLTFIDYATSHPISLQPCNNTCALLERLPNGDTRLKHCIERWYHFNREKIMVDYAANPEAAARFYPHYCLPTQSERLLLEDRRTILQWLKDLAVGWWTFVKERWRLILCLAAPVLTIASAALYMYANIVENNEVQSPYAGSQPRGLPVSRVVSNVRVVTQSADTAYESILHKIISNTLYISVSTGRGVSELIATGVTGNTAIIPRHYVFLLNDTTNHIVVRREKVPVLSVVYVYKEGDIVEIGDTDMAVWYAPKQLGMFRDITSYFWSEDQLSKPMPGEVSILNMSGQGGTAGLPKIMRTPCRGMDTRIMSENPLNHEIFTIPIAITYSFAMKGMCGCLVLKVSGQNPIMGMHVSGTGNGPLAIGHAVPICKEYFNRPVLELGELPQLKPLSQSQMTFESNLALKEYGVVPTGLVPRQPSETKIIPSLVHDQLDNPPQTFPVCLSSKDERWVHSKSPLLSGCEKYGVLTTDFNERDLLQATNALDSAYMGLRPVQQVKYHDIVSAIEGYPGVEFYDHMAMNTSAGFGWATVEGKNLKSDWISTALNGAVNSVDPRLIESINYTTSLRRQGIVVPVIFVDLLKDERRKKEKLEKLGGTRIICMSPIDFTIQMRQCMLDFCASFMSRRWDFQHAVGISPDGPDWSYLARRLMNKGDYIVTIDYSNFGPSFNQSVARSAFHIIINWYKQNNAEAYHVKELMAMEEVLVQSFHLMLNLVYQQFSGSPSGSAITTVLNTLVNQIYLLVCWNRLNIEEKQPDLCGLDAFKREVECFCYGDDVIMSVTQSSVAYFNGRTIHDFFSRYGIVVSDDTKSKVVRPYCSLFEAHFLQRSFLMHPIFFDQFLAPIKENIIWDCAQYTWKTDLLQAATLENCDQALRLAYGHGPDKFNFIKAKINKALITNNIKPLVLTWEDLDINFFFEKHGAPAPHVQACSEEARFMRISDPDMTVVCEVPWLVADYIDVKNIEFPVEEYENVPTKAVDVKPKEVSFKCKIICK